MVSRRVSRRSFLRRVVGTSAVAGGSLALVGCGPLLAAAGGCTDGDVGGSADPSGSGRGCEQRERTGVNDEDLGANGDSLGYGRGANAAIGRLGQRAASRTPMAARTRILPGAGRGGQGARSAGAINGVTDRDAGHNADLGGEGRGGGWGRN